MNTVVAPAVSAYVMACIGGALALRCLNRSLLMTEGSRAGWLALGAASLGCGVWSMHFIALTGFTVEGSRIGYDLPMAAASLAVAVVVAGLGLFVLGLRGPTPLTLTTAAVLMGLGLVAMHHTAMAAIRMQGHLEFRPPAVALSLLVAVTLAGLSLWISVTFRPLAARLGAVLVMGLAMTGMHYTAMTAVIPHTDRTAPAPPGPSPVSLLLSLLTGPVLFLILASAVVLLDPQVVLGKGDWSRAATSRDQST